VPVSDGLVTDHCHEWGEHEYDEADGHRHTDGSKNYTSHKHSPCAGQKRDVPARSERRAGSGAWTRNVYSADKANMNTAIGSVTVGTVAVAPMRA
jgi:hypothetical protein